MDNCDESSRSGSARIAVVIPCYRVADHVLDLIARIGSEVGWIIAVDDACPERTGDLIENKCEDARVKVLRHTSNRGVGGAVMTGYEAARTLPADVVVKLDGDGQMDSALIPALCAPLLNGRADYAKGNAAYAPCWQRDTFVHHQAVIRLLAAVRSYQWLHRDTAATTTRGRLPEGSTTVFF